MIKFLIWFNFHKKKEKALKMKAKIIAAGAAAVIILVIAVLAMSGPVAAETYTVTPGTAELYFTEVGEAKADRSVSIYSFSAGKLSSVDVTKGQSVKEGDVICRIDPSDYINSIEQLEGSLRGYLAETGSGSRIQGLSVSQAEKNEQSEKENFDKMNELYSSGAVSRSELDAARLRHDNALTDLRQSREQLALIQNGGSAGANAEVSRLQIKRLEQNVEDCVIRAPISGIVTSLPARDTNLITNQMLVAVIESEEDIKIEVAVNTSDIDNISVGDTVELSLIRRGGDKTFGGKVSHIDQNAGIKITSKGNEERLIKVTVTPDRKDEFKVGYDVDVKFSYYREENQLIIPKSAVFSENGGSFVWLVRNGKAEKQPIEIKKALRSEVSVAAGIAEGDMIVIDAGAAGLRAGKRIK